MARKTNTFPVPADRFDSEASSTAPVVQAAGLPEHPIFHWQRRNGMERAMSRAPSRAQSFEARAPSRAQSAKPTQPSGSMPVGRLQSSTDAPAPRIQLQEARLISSVEVTPLFSESNAPKTIEERAEPAGAVPSARVPLSTTIRVEEPLIDPTLRPRRNRLKSRVLRPSNGNRYHILGSIHRGGMGEILLGKIEGPEGFSKRVVLKGLLSKLSHDEVSYQLFMREARLMGYLDHPNVIRVFDLPMISGTPYLAMEYLRGRNFHQVIQRASAQGKQIPPRLALYIVSQALRGLHYAHSTKDESGELLGVIHRDVSPGNLLVSFFGEVKLTDFGIAKMADSPRFTSPKSIRGKARYVAPEQVHGNQATCLSDIYSAGVVLAEALMGAPLWERPTVPETLLAIVSEDRELTIDRVLEKHGELPGVRAALRGALALKPQDRFDSALHFAEILEAIAEALGPPCCQVELGLFIRDLFHDAPDRPVDDGFGRSGLPIPQFKIDHEDTEDTEVQLGDDDLMVAALQDLRDQEALVSAAPVDRTEPMLEPKPVPEVPMDPAATDMPFASLVAEMSAARAKPPRLSQLQGDSPAAIRLSATPAAQVQPQADPFSPIVHSVRHEVGPVRTGRTIPPPMPTSSQIRAQALPMSAAVIQDPAEPLEEFRFSELIDETAVSQDRSVPEISLHDTDEEASEKLPTPIRRAQPRQESALTTRAMSLLLAGVFIGASLAIGGCLLALLISG